MTSVRTCLWFDGTAEAAADAYVALIPGSGITRVHRARSSPAAFLVELSLGGVPYSFMNGGPSHRLTPATSIEVRCADQAEVDRLWAVLAAGGAPGRSGWLVDRFGVSWQVIPQGMIDLIGASDDAAAGRLFTAMGTMEKLDLSALQAAARG